MSMNAIQQSLQGARQRFDSLPANDRRALVIMVVAILLTVIYFAFSASLRYQKASILHYKDAREDARWINLNMPELKKMAGAAQADKPAASAAPTDTTLIGLATTSAKPFGIVFKRFQPEGDTSLRLWIEEAPFDGLMKWVAGLGQLGITLDQLDVDRLDGQPGLVDARILVTRTP